MASEVRIQALGALFNYIPPSTFKNLEQLPDLFIAMLCHCSRARVIQTLPFWASSSLALSHVVSGVWSGIPGRQSYIHMEALADKAPNTFSGTRVIILALYIFLRRKMFEVGVPAKFTDGTLYTCMDAILRHNQGAVDMRLPEVTTNEYADVQQRMHDPHVLLTEKVVYLRAVLSNNSQPATQQLIKALRISHACEQIRRSPETKKLMNIQDGERTWRYKTCQPLNIDEARRLLHLHNCVTQAKELEELDDRDKRLFFRIDNTTCSAILATIATDQMLGRIFCVQLADDQKMFALLGMMPADFYVHVRWGMYWTLQQVLMDQATTPGSGPVWENYAFAPIVCQLWCCPLSDHWSLALSILREWCGLRPCAPHVELERQKRIHEEVLPALLRRYTTPFLGKLLPYVLAYSPVYDMMRLNGLTGETFIGTETKGAAVYDDDDDWNKVVGYLLTTKDGEQQILAVLAKGIRMQRAGINSASGAAAAYSTSKLQVQFQRVKNNRHRISSCTTYEDNFWQLCAETEQAYREEKATSKMPPLDGGDQKHQCIHMFDWPIAFTKSEYGYQEIYCDSYFPVREINRDERPFIDLPESYFYILNAFNKSNLESVKIEIKVPIDEQLNFMSPPRLLLHGEKRKSPVQPGYSPESETGDDGDTFFGSAHQEKQKQKKRKIESSGTLVVSKSITTETLMHTWNSAADLDDFAT